MEKVQNKNQERHKLFISEFKGKKNCELIKREIVEKKIDKNTFVNWTDLEKRIRSDKSIEFYEYKAEIYDNFFSNPISEVRSLSIHEYESKKLDEYIYEKLLNFDFDNLIFRDSFLDIEFPKNIYKVKKFSCNGKKTKGIINFEKYSKLEEVYILNFNKLIKFTGDALTVTHVTIWYYNPSNRSIENIIQTFPNLEELVLNNTNIDNIDNLSELKNLKKLEISKASNLKNINVLIKMSNIESVRFESCNKIENIDFFNLSEEQIYRFKKYKILEW